MEEPPPYDPPPYSRQPCYPGSTGAAVGYCSQVTEETKKPLPYVHHDPLLHPDPAATPCPPAYPEPSAPPCHPASFHNVPESVTTPLVPPDGLGPINTEQEVRVFVEDPSAYPMDSIVWGPWGDIKEAEVSI